MGLVAVIVQHRRPQLAQQLLEFDRRISLETRSWVKRDLQRFLETARSAHRDLDRELVECRRQARYTGQYAALETRAEQAINTLGKYITFALLKFGSGD